MKIRSNKKVIDPQKAKNQLFLLSITIRDYVSKTFTDFKFSARFWKICSINEVDTASANEICQLFVRSLSGNKMYFAYLNDKYLLNAYQKLLTLLSAKKGRRS